MWILTLVGEPNFGLVIRSGPNSALYSMALKKFLLSPEVKKQLLHNHTFGFVCLFLIVLGIEPRA